MFETMALRVADQITQAIITGEFASGTRLDETRLAKQYGLSRTPIREALVEVCARGLAERTPYKGVEVIRPDRGTVLERFEALAEMEALCASLAAQRITLQASIVLESFLHEMSEASDDHDRYSHLNSELHSRISELVGNVEITKIAQGSRRRLEMMRRVQLSDPVRIQASLAEHRELVAAICNREAALAATLMRKHIRAAAARTLVLLDAT